MKRAYGGVLINEVGRVLLRKPKALHKARVWTFAKGKPEDGETAEQTALREVLEETGVRARIVRPVTAPGDEFENAEQYFLMEPLEETGQFDEETTAIVWATRPEAEDLISLTGDPEKRTRDLRILQRAFEMFNSLRGLLPTALPRHEEL